jgi:hypothetical protein
MFFKGYGVVGNLTFALGLAFPIWALYESKKMGEQSLPIIENDPIYNLIKEEQRKENKSKILPKERAPVHILRVSSNPSLEPDI